MANWYGTCRSNYFKVKDLEAFADYVGRFEADLISDDEGRRGFVSQDEYGSTPTTWPEDDEADPISILDGIAEHLFHGEVCVVLEAGAEKARYISGLAIAIAWTGERTQISLSEIYAKAKTEFGPNAQVTEAIY